MLAYPIAIAAVLMGVDAKSSSSSSSPTITHRHKLDFMRAMKTDARSQQRRRKLTEETQKEFKNTLYGNTNESKSLRKKLMSKAKVVEPGSDMHRKLNGEVEEKKDDTTTRKLNYQDQTDDYYSMQGGWANGFTFDAAQFSLSYNRCAAVRQFDDELAAQEDSMDVFATKQYAIFRFCPEATCMGYVDDMEQCGCEEQCQWHGDGGNGNGENNEEQCEEACEAQCHAFQKWQRQGGSEGGWNYAFSRQSGSSSYYGNRNLQNKYTTYNNAWSDYPFNFYRNYEEGYTDEVFGSRGDGCQANYGEYMILLEDYMNLMLEFQDDRFETYWKVRVSIFVVWFRVFDMKTRRFGYFIWPLLAIIWLPLNHMY